MGISLCDTARVFREELGWTSGLLETALGLEVLEWSRFETYGSNQDLIVERVRRVFEIDLFVYAATKSIDVTKLPPAIRESTQILLDVWKINVAKAITKHKR